MRRLRDERGSVAIIVAVSSIAMFAMGAVVVDVGALLQERRTLQNGADAAALAVAAECAAGDCGSPSATSETYADANADDEIAAVEEICGSGVTGYSGCEDPPDVPDGADYVRVTTATEQAGGSSEIAYTFARFLGLDGHDVRARATVAWGGPAGLTSALPMTISECEYDAYTSNGEDLKEPPPYTDGYPTPEAVIYMHDTTGASPCESGPAGSDLPGGFGWLDTSSGCTATSEVGDWYDDSTGVPPPNSCTPAMMAALLGDVVALPIFDETNDLNGANGEYHIRGFAAFYVTGYSIVGQYTEESEVTGELPCTGQATCISGFFVNQPAPVDGSIGGPSMGVTVIQLVS